MWPQPPGSKPDPDIGVALQHCSIAALAGPLAPTKPPRRCPAPNGRRPLAGDAWDAWGAWGAWGAWDACAHDAPPPPEMEMEMEVVHCGHCAERSEHGLCGRDAGARAVPDVTCDDRAQAIADGAHVTVL